MISGLSEQEIFLIIIVVVVVVVIILISLLAYFFHRWFITREPGELFNLKHLSMIFLSSRIIRLFVLVKPACETEPGPFSRVVQCAAALS